MLSVLRFDLRIFRLGVSDAGHCLLCAAARWFASPYARRRGALNQLVPIICQRCAYPGWLFSPHAAPSVLFYSGSAPY